MTLLAKAILASQTSASVTTNRIVRNKPVNHRCVCFFSGNTVRSNIHARVTQLNFKCWQICARNRQFYTGGSYRVSAGSGHNSVTVSLLEFRWNLWICKRPSHPTVACEQQTYFRSTLHVKQEPKDASVPDRLVCLWINHVAAPRSKGKRLVTTGGENGAWNRVNSGNQAKNSSILLPFLKVVWRWHDDYKLC